MAKIILDLAIDGNKAISTMNELSAEIKKQNELMKKAKIGSDEYNKTAKNVHELKTAQKGLTTELTRAEKARKKETDAMAKERAKQQELIASSRMEVKSTDDMMKKKNALIKLRNRANLTTEKGRQAHAAMGKEINSLNDKLKKSDAAIGNHQRKVGDYPNKMGAATKSTGNFNKGLATMAVGIGVAIAALKQIYAAVKGSIDLFLVQEEANLKVTNTFGNYANTINDAANATQELTRIGNEEFQQMAINASNLGVANEDVNKTVQDSIALQALFADSGLNSEMSMKALIKAQNGEFGALEEFIPALKEANTETEKQAILTEVTAKGFVRAQENAEGYAGQIAQIQNAYGDFQEVVGKQILEGLFDPKQGGAAVDGINAIIEALEKTKFIKTLMDEYKGAFNKAFKPLFDIALKLGIVTDKADALQVVFNILIGAFNYALIPMKLLYGIVGNVITQFSSLYDILTGVKELNFENVFKMFKETLLALISPYTDVIGLTDKLNDILGVTKRKAEEASESLIKLEAVGKENTGLRDSINEGNEALETQIELTEEAKKKNEAFQASLAKINDEYVIASYFANNRQDEIDAEKKKAQALFDTYKNFFAEGGYTGAELEKLEALRDGMLKFYVDIKEAQDSFDAEQLNRSSLKIENPKSEQEIEIENNRSALEQMSIDNAAADDAEYQRKEANANKLIELQKKQFNDMASISEEYATALSGVLTSSIDETGLNLEKFGKSFSLFILDIMQKVVITSVAETIAKSFALNPLAGGIIAGVSVGLIKAAFGVAKNAITKPTGFAEGGYTGTGGKYEAAGTVHKGEVVFSQSDVAQLGGASEVDRMRPSSKQNFYTGGVVGNIATPGASQNAQLLAAIRSVQPIVTVEAINAVATAENNRQQLAVI